MLRFSRRGVFWLALDLFLHEVTACEVGIWVPTIWIAYLIPVFWDSIWNYILNPCLFSLCIWELCLLFAHFCKDPTFLEDLSFMHQDLKCVKWDWEIYCCLHFAKVKKRYLVFLRIVLCIIYLCWSKFVKACGSKFVNTFGSIFSYAF